MNGYEGICMSGGSFFSNDKWQIKLLSGFQFTFNLLWMTQTQEIITCRVSKIYKWNEGMCMHGGKFLKEWQVTDKVIEWIFSQFTFNLLKMTQTQEIIIHRVLKIHEWIWRCVWAGKSFLSNDKWWIKLLSEFFQFTFNLLSITQTWEIITCRFLKIHEWIQGDVYEWGKVS